MGRIGLQSVCFRLWVSVLKFKSQEKTEKYKHKTTYLNVKTEEDNLFMFQQFALLHVS